MKIYKWSIPRTQLLGLGYAFKKLYARNYQVYNKSLGYNHKIWLWVVDKLVEVNDWGGYTYSLIEFYKSNKHLANSNGFFKCQLNYTTGVIQVFDQDTYSVQFKKTGEDMEKAVDSWYEKYPPEQWGEILFKIESMEILIKELELLQLEVFELHKS